MARYIELDKAIEQFCSYGSVFTYGDNVCKAIVSRLKQVPTADVRENVHAHWIHERLVSTGGGSYPVVRCSACQWQYPMSETRFCPNCGAEMERGEDERM